MRGYRTVETQEDMDSLLKSIAGFHDSLTKEIHLVNRGFVDSDKSMHMGHQFDAQVLIQSQWDPLGMELLFISIKELHLEDSEWYWGASGLVELTKNTGEKRITMSFDSEFRIVSANLLFRPRQDWFGKKSHLRSEVPSTEVVVAKLLQDGWRQCSSCKNAWQEELNEEFSYCLACGHLTQLEDFSS